MKFGQLVEYNIRNIFLEKSYAKCGRETIPRPFSKKSKVGISLDQYSKGITKPCTHLHPAPSTPTWLISTSTQLHPPLPSLFQSLSSTLQHPQQYLNQKIARNWAISPNLGQKIKSCPF